MLAIFLTIIVIELWDNSHLIVSVIWLIIIVIVAAIFYFNNSNSNKHRIIIYVSKY